MRMRPNIYIIVLVAFLAIGSAAILEGINRTSNQATTSVEPKTESSSEVSSNVILHLILDEHIGLDGIPMDIKPVFAQRSYTF